MHSKGSMEVQWFALTVLHSVPASPHSPEACLVRLPITVVNVEPVSVSPETAWRPVHAVLSLSPYNSWDGLRPPVALSRIHTRERIHGV